MKRVLWLASWYPNKTDPYTGDFIERHARAASLYSQIELLHVVKDNSPSSFKKFREERRKYPEGFEACIIYYQTSSNKSSWIEKLKSNYQYWKIHKNYYKNYVRRNGKPDGIHVHIALKSGIVALCLKFLFRVDYLVTEHWSGILPEARPNLDEKSWMTRFLWKWVMQQSSGYSAVSEHLSAAIRNRFSLGNGTVIPNVVDPGMFYPAVQKENLCQFIHVTSKNQKFQKNTLAVLEASAVVSRRIPEYKLVIFGETSQEEKDYIKKMQLGSVVELHDFSPQEIFRKYLQKCDALIIYSRYETFGCVVIEANACAVPVIVSDIPVFHENVKAGLTGAFAKSDSPQALADAILTVAGGRYFFDGDEIRNWALIHYSFEKIGKQFASFYEEHFS